MTIVQLSGPEAAAALLAHLRAQGDVSAERLGPDRLRISLLGSYGEQAMRAELLRRLHAWTAAETDADTGVVVRLQFGDA